MAKMDGMADALRPRLIGEAKGRAYLGGIGHAKWWELIAKGDLDAVAIDGRTLVTVDSADSLIERGMAKAAKKRAERAGSEAAA